MRSVKFKSACASLSIHNPPSEESDQTASRRLVWIISYVRVHMSEGTFFLTSRLLRKKGTKNVVWHLSSLLFFFFFFYKRLKIFTSDWKEIICKVERLKDRMSNSVDSDETAHHEPSHLDLRCLQMLFLSPVAVNEFIKQPSFPNQTSTFGAFLHHILVLVLKFVWFGVFVTCIF